MRVIDLNTNEPPARITILSYGAMRAGKSRFAAGFPRPLFLADATESGWETIRNMDPALFYEPNRKPEVGAIEKSVDMMKAIDDIEKGLVAQPGRWLTVVIDSLTFYSDLFFNAVYNAAASGGRQADVRQCYGQLGNHLRDLRIRIHSLPLHVVWLALEKSPGEENPFGGPLLSGQASQKFAAGVDYILYHRSFQQGQQGPQWEIRTRQYGQYKAGGRDEGMLPDPLGFVEDGKLIPECSYRAFAQALGLVDPLPFIQAQQAQGKLPLPAPAPVVARNTPLPTNGGAKPPTATAPVARRVVVPPQGGPR